MTAGGRSDRLMEKSPPVCLLSPVNLLDSQLSITAHSQTFYKLLMHVEVSGQNLLKLTFERTFKSIEQAAKN